jgi:hypothetical protein
LEWFSGSLVVVVESQGHLVSCINIPTSLTSSYCSYSYDAHSGSIAVARGELWSVDGF